MLYFDIPAGQYTPAQVRAAAWFLYAQNVREFLCSTYSGAWIPRPDRRFKFNREVEALARKIINSKGLAGIMADRQKHRDRTRARVESEKAPRNILAAPLVRDYYAHRSHVRRVLPDRLQFDGRNHWAKNDRDSQILAILAKNFKKYQNGKIH
ncbi:MAG: hypothetical protein IJL45_05575 [Prevotella sp.]|nr:hypothetical protein [Prevotella sp.]MBQ6728270.1 hypothetical protein [Clostridia bacterium]